jgi:deoxyadenosine/deoxycytidine kinase
LKELIQQKDLFQSVTITDYLFTKCLLFAKVNLPDDEFRLYQRLFDIILAQLVQPELVIYLHAPVSKLQENIRKRNRSYELNIPDDYLFSIQETYTHYIKQHNLKTLFVDASNADFLTNEKHLQTIIDALDKDYPEGQHYISLP